MCREKKRNMGKHSLKLYWGDCEHFRLECVNCLLISNELRVITRKFDANRKIIIHGITSI